MGKKNKITWQPKRELPAKTILFLIVGGILLAALGIGAELLFSRKHDAVIDGVGFSEVMTNNASALTDDYGAYSDWFELNNSGSAAVDIGGWMVMRGGDATQTFIFADGTVIAPGEYLTVFASGMSKNKLGYVLHAPYKLDSAGDVLTLSDRKGNIVQELNVPALSRNAVYALCDGQWQTTMSATPGSENVMAEVTEKESSVSSGSVEISEVVIKNRTILSVGGEYPDYIELHNIAGRAVSLKGMCLSDDETRPDKFALPDVTLQADEYLVVYACDAIKNADGIFTGFSLSADEGVYLSDASGKCISSTVPSLPEKDTAWSLVNGKWVNTFPATPGAANDFVGIGEADALTTQANTSNIHISELMASTDSEEVTSAGYDWIELYNASSGALDLSGWGLSDNSGRPRKWQFPAGAVIDPGKYMVVMCSGKDTKSEGRYHTNFALSVDGGYTVTLSDPSGNVVDRMPVMQQYANVSYGRAYGMSGLRYFEEATPGSANTAYGYTGRSSGAEYSVRGGIFNEGQTITVSLSAPAGSTIYYTLDCTEPTATSRMYTEPFTISDTTILRTAVYTTGMLPSYIDTQSYLFGISHQMRVVSLVTDPANLWDEDTGIYVKGKHAWDEYPYGAMNQGANYWMDWEKAANVEVFTQEGETMLSQGCGLKIQGQFSRSEDQKGLKIIADSKYSEENRFHAALFDDRDYTEYQSFVLRAGGQDTQKTRVRDILQTSYAEATDVMYQAYEMCVVYLNGEYWGHYNMRERINKYSIMQWEGWDCDPDSIDIIKGNSIVMQGSNASFNELLTWIKKEGGATYRLKQGEKLTQADYDEILAHIEKYVDVDNYLDYVAMQIYTGNTDLLNVKRYRSVEEDGLWRYILFDTDTGFIFLDTNSVRRWLDPEGAGSGKKTDNTLYIELMKNPAIVDKFMHRFNELFVQEFNSQTTLEKLDGMYRQLETEIDAHNLKWGVSRTKYDDAWDTLIKNVKERPNYVFQYFQEVYGFSDAQMQDYFGESLALIEAFNNK